MGSFLHQFLRDDPPCDLCLLQRAAMLGTALALLLNLRHGIRVEYYAVAIANSLFGFLVSLYHIAVHLDPEVPIYSKPVLGQYLYIWSFWIFLSSLTSLIILVFLFGLLPKSTKLYNGWSIVGFILTMGLALSLLITTFPR